jgi:hypothetical protein
MRDLPTGRELAESYDFERRAGFWAQGPGVEMMVPELPGEGGNPDDISLLPPLPN